MSKDVNYVNKSNGNNSYDNKKGKTWKWIGSGNGYVNKNTKNVIFFGILNNKSHKHLVGEKYSFSCLPHLLTDNEHSSDMTC